MRSKNATDRQNGSYMRESRSTEAPGAASLSLAIGVAAVRRIAAGLICRGLVSPLLPVRAGSLVSTVESAKLAALVAVRVTRSKMMATAFGRRSADSRPMTVSVCVAQRVVSSESGRRHP
jgi:hypothetical protein